MKTQTLAIFDVDGTLYNFDTELSIALFLYKKKKISFWWLCKLGLLISTLHLQKRPRIEKKSFSFLQRISVDELDALAKEHFEQDVQGKIHPLMKERIAWHKKKGHTIILSSASPDYVIRYIKKEAGADEMIASTFAKDDGRFTGRYLCWNYGEQKRINMEAFITRKGWKVKDSYCYADSWSDIPLLSWSRKAYVVNPGRRLKNHAEHNGWKIIHLD